MNVQFTFEIGLFIMKAQFVLIRKLLPYCQVVVGNEDEFRALAGNASASIADVARQIAAVDYISPPHQQNRCHLQGFYFY